MTSMEVRWAIRPEVCLVCVCDRIEKVQMNYPGRSMPSRYFRIGAHGFSVTVRHDGDGK